MLLPSLLLTAVLSQTTPSTLTLSDALSQAEAQNPDLAVARARLQQADTASAQAWSGYLPTLKAQGGYTHNGVTAVLSLPTQYGLRETGVPQGATVDPNYPGTTPSTQIVVPTQSITVPIQVADQWSGQLSLQQALLVPELVPAIQSAYLSGQSAQLSVQNARRELLYAVTKAYLGAAALRESVAVQEELLAVRVGFEKDADARFSAGDVAKPAVLRARLDRSQAEQALVRTRNSYASARSALAALLGRPLDFEVVRPAEETLAPLEAGASRTDGAQASPQDRLDLQVANLNLELAFGSRRRVIARYLPSLVGTAHFTASNVTGFTGSNTDWNVGLGLSWTLLDGGLREAQLREASARIVENQQTVRGTELRVLDETRRARFELETAEATLVKANEQVAYARETAKLAKENFAAGGATYLEVSDANGARSSAELSSVSEALNLRLARISLARALGRFDPPQR
jgi:outer membrane protein TolC